GAEPGRSMCHTEITIENDSVDAIVATREEILVEVSESVCHSGARVSIHHQAAQPPSGCPLTADGICCPEGATFSQRSLRKSVDSSPTNVRIGLSDFLKQQPADQ